MDLYFSLFFIFDVMMCVTYLIKEDLMSTSNSPRVKRTTAKSHANELGFMASLVSSSDVVQNGRVGGGPRAFQLLQKKKRKRNKQRPGKYTWQALCLGPVNVSKHKKGSLNL